MTRSPIKKVAAIHDLSCVGRCSLTVILPILSCMGIQVCPLPTAVLSTHPGGFTGVSMYDFTPHIADFAGHWQKENLDFDCIYSGFLASDEQIGLVSQFIDAFSTNSPLVLVDPVLGDDGHLYSICTNSMINQIRALVQKADIITPNFTEACFLLDEPWQPVVEKIGTLTPWLARLAEMGPSRIVITGIALPGQKIATLGYDRATKQVWQFTDIMVPAKFPGTGDIFASILLGKLMGGMALPQAVQFAGSFTATTIQKTFSAGTPPREGVLLEPLLGVLCKNNAL